MLRWLVLYYLLFIKSQPSSSSSSSSSSDAAFERYYEHSIVRLAANQSIYLLNRGYRQAISYGDAKKENSTVQAFGFDPSSLISIPMEELSRYPLHPIEVPPVVAVDTSPDETMRVYKLKASILQRQPYLLKNLTKTGNFLNPPISMIQGVCIFLTVDAPCGQPKRSVSRAYIHIHAYIHTYTHTHIHIFNQY
jgi:hypothetical protein